MGAKRRLSNKDLGQCLVDSLVVLPKEALPYIFKLSLDTLLAQLHLTHFTKLGYNVIFGFFANSEDSSADTLLWRANYELPLDRHRKFCERLW